MIYCSVKYCCSNSSIPGVILHSIMKFIKTPNHPTYHWSTLWPLEVWVRGLYNSWWFCVHKLSMFIYLSMGLIRGGILEEKRLSIYSQSKSAHSGYRDRTMIIQHNCFNNDRLKFPFTNEHADHILETLYSVNFYLLLKTWKVIG